MKAAKTLVRLCGGAGLSESFRPIVKTAYSKLFFLFLNQNICCGYSKEPSQLDGSFEHPKYMLRLVAKKIFTILPSNFLLSKPVVFTGHLFDKYQNLGASSNSDPDHEEYQNSRI